MPMAANIPASKRCPDCGGRVKYILRHNGPAFERCVDCGHVLKEPEREGYDDDHG